MSETTGISLFGENVTDGDRLGKYRGAARTGVDEINGTEIRQCPPTFDGLLCWSRTDAPGTATLPCPSASIMGYTSLASDNLRALAMASKVCLPNGEWYQNSDGVSWSNYSLCLLNSTRYVIERNLNYSYETPAEFALLNVRPRPPGCAAIDPPALSVVIINERIDEHSEILWTFSSNSEK